MTASIVLTSETDVEPVNGAEDIVQMIMTQHWDLCACTCWVCEAGRVAGLCPTSQFLRWRSEGYEPVHVDSERWEWKIQRRPESVKL